MDHANVNKSYGHATELSAIEKLERLAARAQSTLENMQNSNTSARKRFRRPLNTLQTHSQTYSARHQLKRDVVQALSPDSQRVSIFNKARASNLISAKVQRIQSKSRAVVVSAIRRRRDIVQNLERVRSSLRNNNFDGKVTTVLPLENSNTISSALEHERRRQTRSNRDFERRKRRDADRALLLEQVTRASTNNPDLQAISSIKEPTSNAAASAVHGSQHQYIIRDLIDQQYRQWSEHQANEQRMLEQQHKTNKLKLDLDRMKQERELKERRLLMERQLNEWSIVQQNKSRQQVEVAAAESLQNTREITLDIKPGTVVNKVQYQRVNPHIKVQLDNTIKRAESIEKENTHLQRQKMQLIQELQEERTLFLKHQQLLIDEKRSGEFAIKKSEELANDLHRHFKSQLEKSRR